jgi:Protein of unknown function (DUF4230)
MMRAMSESTSPGRGGWFWSLVSGLFRLALVAALVYGAYRVGDWFGYTRGHSDGFAKGFEQDKEERTLERTSGPTVAMTVRADEVVLALTTLDEPTPPPVFAEAIDRLYRDLLGQTARVYPFAPGHEGAALQTWDTKRALVSEQAYRQLREWNQQRAPLPGMRLALTHHAAASDAETLLRDQACGVLREVWAVSTPASQGRPILPGLCAVVERELLEPWGKDLLEAAIALDVQAAVTLAETRYRKTIMELATAELSIDAVIRHDYESKLFEGWVIESTDRASLEVRGTGIVKSGFKMDESYAVAVLPEEQRIRVTLPRAQILSNTMVPAFSAEREGWWTSLGTTQRNQALQALQAKVEQQALADGILKEAEDRAVGLVQDLFSPLTALPGSPYEVEVVFAGVSE